MDTICTQCCKEIYDQEVCKCELCGLDGLCPDCSPSEFHDCDYESNNDEDE
jgi:hypothetical protein